MNQIIQIPDSEIVTVPLEELAERYYNSRAYKKRLNPILNFDRDGCINVEKDYLHEVEEFEFEDTAIEALRLATELGYRIAIATGQSGIGRGYYPVEDMLAVHEYMCQELAGEGIRVSHISYCPHVPREKIKKGEEGKAIQEFVVDENFSCACRKPKPGMLFTAALDLDGHIVAYFGDKREDVETGKNVRTLSILVKSGHWQKQEFKEMPDYIAENLFDGVQWVIEHDKR